MSQFGDKGDRVNQLHLPFYCAVDLNDNIIISDNMNYCVKVFDPPGNFLLKIGSGQDWGQRQFLCPYGVCVDPENNILIADSQSSKVSMFSPKGEPMGDIVKKMDGCQVSIFILSKEGIKKCVTKRKLDLVHVLFFINNKFWIQIYSPYWPRIYIHSVGFSLSVALALHRL